MKFFFTSPTFSLSGVNTATANIALALCEMGHDARILITHPGAIDRSPLPVSPGLKVESLPSSRFTPAFKRRRMLADFLEKHAPCIYVPGYDFALSGVSERLSDNIAVLGVMHSDEPVHYDHVKRLGESWNRVIAVSGFLAGEVKRRFPLLAERVVAIPSGVTVPECPPCRDSDCGPLKIAYAGRLSRYQKRIYDLSKIAHNLDGRGMRFSLSISGDGPDRRGLEKKFAGLSERAEVKFLGTLENEAVRGLFRQSHVFLLVSEFEGTPVSLLEAMAEGCTPVVTDLRSGIPELVENGVTGYRAPVGKISDFADRLSILHCDRALLARLSANAREKISCGPYKIETVARRYIEEAEKSFAEARSGAFRR